MGLLEGGDAIVSVSATKKVEDSLDGEEVREVVVRRTFGLVGVP